MSPLSFEYLLIALLLAPCAALSLPTSTSEGGSALAGLVSHVQLEGHELSEKPAKYNYTCAECERMQRALLDICRWNNHESTPHLAEFSAHCSDIAGPISPGFVTEKCEAYYYFVSNLYCPVDPCVQITQQMNYAPDAVCGLIGCKNADEPPLVVEPSEPWSCPKYVDYVRTTCHAWDGNRSDSPSTNQLCSSLPAQFVQEGCIKVADAMAGLVNPVALCASLSCESEEMNAFKFCDEQLKLNATSRIYIAEYETYLRRVNNSDEPGLGEGKGMQIEHATLGSGCNTGVITENNLLRIVREACQNKVTCMLENPSHQQTLRGEVVADGCDTSFVIKYTCSGGKKLHRVFAPSDTTYATLKLDCADDLASSYPFGSREVTGQAPSAKLQEP